MNSIIKSTNLFHKPSFLKGASRIFDLYGKLDEYKYTNNADYEAIKKDWQHIISNSIQN